MSPSFFPPRPAGRAAAAPVGLVLAVLLAPALHAQLPAELAEVVLGARKQAHFDVVLGGHACRALRTDAPHPYLVWSAAAANPLPVPRDRGTAVLWLRSIGPALGHGAFPPRFRTTERAFGLEVWVYDLVLDGRRVLDAEVRLYWQAGRCIGLRNGFPGPLASVDAPAVQGRDAVPTDDDVYWVDRRADGTHLVRARLVHSMTERHAVTEVVTAAGTVVRIKEQRGAARDSSATFTEFTIPNGTFPDQIHADSSGVLWTSQPTNNQILAFDPGSGQWRQFATTGGNGPDGLMVDGHDRVWTGLYNSGHLGLLDAATGAFSTIALPYSPASAAIPTSTMTGTVWVTDHQYNRLSEYDPVAQRWVQSLIMPTAAAWVVAGSADPSRGDLWFCEYNAHKLAHKPNGQPLVEVATPTRAGPAFCVVRDDKVYYTQWNLNRLGEYDVRTRQFTEYAYVAGENGGPLAIAPNGEVVVGTRNVGYISVFDPGSGTFQNHKIPTASAGLKDGMTIAPDGAIWFTESGRQKIARLVLR